MSGRRVLITGGTGGIGQATALALARAGARVVVTGRGRASAEGAVARLRSESGGEVDFLLGDLATRAGVVGLAGAFAGRFERLDVLIHNAGLMASRREVTEDGVESGLAVNAVAPLLLTHALLGSLRAAPGARVIALTGGSHPSRVDLDNLQGERGFVALDQYSHHKLVMMGVMRELARRLGPGGPTVNVCYPGQAVTSMTRGVTAGDMPLLMRLLWPVFRLMMREDGGRSAARASRSSVHLASAPELEGVTGRYFDTKAREVRWPGALEDAKLCGRLWGEIEGLAGLTGATW